MDPLIRYKILEVISETQDAKSYVLEPLNKDFTYKAGQFITFIFHQHNEEIRRSYSLNSSPLADKYPSITVKRIANGSVSRHIHKDWKEGMIVEGLAPAGRFYLDESLAPKELFFFAAGSGIIPIIGIIKDSLLRYPTIKIKLLYSNKSERSTIFLKQIQALAAEYKDRFALKLFYSDSQNLGEARLSKFALSEMLDSSRHAQYFVCGPHYYMQMVRIVLLSGGIDKEQIRQEIFEILPPPEKLIRRFSNVTRPITLILGDQSYTLDVPPQLSILDAALSEGIQAPFNCRAGRCSACLARCERGQVRMHYNEVLTDKDLEEGLILSCTAHPLSDDVIVRF